MEEEEKINRRMLYCPSDPELVKQKLIAHNLSVIYNQTLEEDYDKRRQIIEKLFKSVGENCRIQGPLFIHYGNHTTLGNDFFGNFNLTIQDDAEVSIGDDCNFGPGATLVTPIHPLVASERQGMAGPDGKVKRYCYAKPIHIGSHCWFGANVTVCPGVTIGEGCVIGAGSVVTHDIPDNSMAYGVPCKVIRRITEKDSLENSPDILGDVRIIHK